MPGKLRLEFEVRHQTSAGRLAITPRTSVKQFLSWTLFVGRFSSNQVRSAFSYRDESAVRTFQSLLRRLNCSATLTCNPLSDEERAVDELHTLRFTLNQKSNAGSIQKVNLLQVELWRVRALFNFRLQLRQILLPNSAAQLKNGWFTQKLFDA
jgi:hypothetical protein